MFPCLEISDLCNFEVSLWWTLLSSTRAQASWGLPSSLHLGCGHIFLECLLVGHDVKSFCFRWPSGCNPPGRCTFKDSPGTARSSWPGWPRSCSPIMEELKYFLISLVQFYFKLSCLYFTGSGCCQLGLSTRRQGAQLCRMGISATFQHHNSNIGANIHASKCFTFFQGYHSLESSPTASNHLVTSMTPSPPLH